jgi:glucose/arabinose dehydrogenase
MTAGRSLPWIALGWVTALGQSVAAQTFNDPFVQASVYATGLQFPTSFAFLPGEAMAPVDLLVLEKFTGRVQHFRNGVFQGTALDLAVSNFGERGLLGIAVHPRFSTTRRVYLYYTASPTGMDAQSSADVLDNRVARCTWNGATLDSVQTILSLPAASNFVHIGGVITFGPDSLLYGIIGDVGVFGQLANNPGGVPPGDTSMIFRIRDDGSAPPDNPYFALGGAMQKVYAFGIRNSFGIEFDPVTNVLWETENGTSQYDEVNRVLPRWNGGWSRILGPDARDPDDIGSLWYPTPDTTYSDPEFSWVGSVAPTAIHFLRGDALGADPFGTPYRDGVFIAAYNTAGIYRFELTQDRTQLVMPDASVADLVADTGAERDLFSWGSNFGGGVVDLDTGPDGALYALRFENGTLFRITRAATSSPGDLPRRAPLEIWPNPSRGVVFVRAPHFEASGALRIHSAAGRLIAVVHGRDAFTWDGRDRAGRTAPPGVYFARLDGDSATHRLVRIP